METKDKINPMSTHLVTSLKDLEQAGRVTAWVGNQEVMAVMTPQGVRVYSGMCPHQGGPLGEGPMAGDKITCPWHGCIFELNDGACTDIGTCRHVSGMKLKALEFKVADSNVYVELG